MPYTIINAIEDEVEFLTTLAEVEKNEQNILAAAIVRQQLASLRRILRRVDSGYEYEIQRDTVTGKPSITFKKTDRKTLEQEYPALKKAAEQYNLIENLVDSTPDD